MLSQDLKILRRYREIIGILVKYGFRDKLADNGISSKSKFWDAILPQSVLTDLDTLSKYERMRLAVEELGTTFIKFAQILSNRPDMIPLELVHEFEKLQSNVPPFPGSEAKEIIEKELGKPIEEVFTSFEIEPFASASIAQVHRAKLKNGEDVVIKVRRPGIRETIELDIMIMKYISRKANERGYLLNLDMPGIIRTFDDAIHREVNLLHEGYNLQRFTQNFKDSDYVFVPKYYPEYTTQSMLTMEYVDGVHPYDTEGIARIGSDPHVLARNGLKALFFQIFEHCFFHADPHPGNLFAMPGNKVCFIDFGMMGTVLKQDIEFFADIVYGITSKDAKLVIWGLKNISISQQFEDKRSFEYEVVELINEYHSQPLDKVNMAELFKKLLDLVNRYNIQMPGDYFLLSKSLVTIEGVGRRLDPSLNIIEEIKPHINRTIKEEFQFKAILKRFLSSTKDSVMLIESLPRDLRDIIAKIKKGEIKISVEHEGIEELTKKIEQSSNRISGGFILGSILMSSAILIAVKFPPTYQHWSIPGALGFLVANILGLRMVFTTMDKKKK